MSTLIREEQLVYGRDYKLEWAENISKGRGTVTVTGLGEYGATKSLTFKINAKKAN